MYVKTTNFLTGPHYISWSAENGDGSDTLGYDWVKRIYWYSDRYNEHKAYRKLKNLQHKQNTRRQQTDDICKYRDN